MSNTQAIGIERSGDGSLRVGVLDVLSSNSRINQRNDTTESGGGRESRIRTDRWDADNKWVEVLLSGDKATSGCNSSITGSQFCNDIVGLGELAARVGSCQQELDGATSQSSSLSWASQVGQGSNSRDCTISLFLTEAGFDNGSQKGGENSLSIHFEYVDL